MITSFDPNSDGDFVTEDVTSGAGNEWRGGRGKPAKRTKTARRKIRMVSAGGIDAIFVGLIRTMAFSLFVVSYLATYASFGGVVDGRLIWSPQSAVVALVWQSVATILTYGGLNRYRQTGEASNLIAVGFGLAMSAVPTGLWLDILFGAMFAAWGWVGDVVIWASAIGADLLPEKLLVEREASK